MKKTFSALAATLLIAPFLVSCGEDGNGIGNPLDGIPGAEQCKLECKGAIEANGSVSGIVSLDAFFKSVVNFNAQAAIVEADLKATLGEMAAALGLEVEAGASVEDLKGEIVGYIDAGFGGNIEGSVELDYVPPKCAVSAQATLQAAAKCDAEVKPGSASVSCKGSCEGSASAEVSCEGGMLKCSGTAPSFECSGSCSGSCELEVAAKCEGTCKGTCTVESEAECDGEFTADGGGASGSGSCKLNAGAKCEGECQGSCELSGGGTCEGKCTGECEYTAPAGGCEGTAPKCEAMGEASVKCEGECKGEVEPPEVKAECEASVKADAEFSAECTPPSVGLSYELAANGDASVDAEARLMFEAKLKAFAKAYGKFLAKAEKLELVANAGAELGVAAESAVEGAIEDFVDGDVDFAVIAGATCAGSAIGGVVTLLDEGVGSLQASGEAVVEINAALVP